MLSGVCLTLRYSDSVVLLHRVQCFHPGLDGLQTSVYRRESSVTPSRFGALAPGSSNTGQNLVASVVFWMIYSWTSIALAASNAAGGTMKRGPNSTSRKISSK